MEKGSSFKKPKELPPTASEWAALRKLLPESDGVFSLSVRTIDEKPKRTLEEKCVQTFFAPYNIISASFKPLSTNPKQVAFISFPSYFTAYRAWRERDKTKMTGNNIRVAPACGNANTLTTGSYLLVSGLPDGLLMSTFVTQFAKFQGLLCINPLPREHSAVIGYTSIESALKACSEINDIKAEDGRYFPITVQLLAERPLIQFGSVSSSQLKLVQNGSMKPTRKAGAEEEENLDSHLDLPCSFCMNYKRFCHMFQVTCRKKPSILQNISNEIQFLITHRMDSTRFWGWLISGSKASIKKLNKIEKRITSTVKNAPPPYVLPKEGQCGVGLYKNGWYRCYILSTCKKDEIEVVFFDYGNTEIISKQDFRFTYDDDIWTLPPQAVPFELQRDGLKNSCNGIEGQVLKATVMTEKYSQPHIIEIKDIFQVRLESPIVEHKFSQSSYGTEEPTNSSNRDVQDCSNRNGSVNNNITVSSSTSGSGSVTTAEQDRFQMTSIFSFDEEDLALGLLSEVHHPNLLYLKFGDMQQCSVFQKNLDGTDLILPNSLAKGKVLLLSTNNQRRRVQILQVFTGFAQVKVLHVDYGVIEWVSIKDLFHLERDLREQNFQVRAAALAGINCCQKMEEAVLFLKSKIKVVIMSNTIHQSSAKKMYVELFDVKSGQSINKEMIDKGIAVRVSNVFDYDDIVLPDMIPLANLEAHVPQVHLLPLIERMLPDRTDESREIESLLNNLKFESLHDGVSSLSS